MEPYIEFCCNCTRTDAFIVLPDGQRQCECGLKWRNREQTEQDQPLEFKVND